MDKQDPQCKCKKLGFPRKVDVKVPLPSKEVEDETLHDPWENVSNVLNWGSDGEE